MMNGADVPSLLGKYGCRFGSEHLRHGRKRSTASEAVPGSGDEFAGTDPSYIGLHARGPEKHDPAVVAFLQNLHPHELSQFRREIKNTFERRHVRHRKALSRPSHENIALGLYEARVRDPVQFRISFRI